MILPLTQMVWCVQASCPACPVDCPVRVLRAGSRREHGEAPHAWHCPQGITHSTDTGEHTHHCIASLSQSVSQSCSTILWCVVALYACSLASRREKNSSSLTKYMNAQTGVLYGLLRSETCYV